MISANWIKIVNFSVLKNVGKFKIETPKTFRIDDFSYLRSKAYSVKCNDKTQ